MSLLLEALKKAELAKQAAKEALPTGAQPFTRDKLPDITQPMEIHSDDLSQAGPAQAPASKLELELAPEEPAPRTAPATESASTMRAASFEPAYTPPSEPAEPRQAQQLFEAKELDINPRKPFYYTVGALGLFALCTVGYFWYEMQPKNNYRIPPPSAAAPVAGGPAAPSAPAAPVTPAATTVTPPIATQPAEPPATAAKSAAAPPAVPVTTPARRTVIARKGGPAATTARQPQSVQREGNIVITPARVQPDPVLEDAFDAFNAGDLARSRSGYQQVLQSRPDNRDALLGLAAVEMRSARPDAAESYYLRLLELDPRDAQAQAGLMGLRGQIDPVAAESRVKTMIAAQPEATFLYFTLGNQYAAQRRWAEAQQAYFKAYSGDPGHPDFAYNLAISLDQLHQTKSALEYYRRALALAQERSVSFDKAQVNKRVSQLER
ncbi:MAG: tetratricopeptide repeat protein [Pseudomonadota bacterium]